MFLKVMEVRFKLLWLSGVDNVLCPTFSLVESLFRLAQRHYASDTSNTNNSCRDEQLATKDNANASNRLIDVMHLSCFYVIISWKRLSQVLLMALAISLFFSWMFLFILIFYQQDVPHLFCSITQIETFSNLYYRSYFRR